MTNKQERYFVVSESELERLREAAFEVANSHPARLDEIREAQDAEKTAEAACRAREVELDSMRTQDGKDIPFWTEVKK